MIDQEQRTFNRRHKHDGIDSERVDNNVTLADLGVTASAAELNTLDGITASTAELNTLDGITATTTELNYTDGVTSAIQTQLNAKADDSAVVHDTGDETIAGVKTFNSDPLIPDEAYGAGWNGSLEPPTKNAVYDKIEALTGTGTKVNITTNDATSPSNTTETDLITTSIPGGTLGTNNGVKIRIFFESLTMNSNGTLTLRLKYGSTTLFTIALPSSSLSGYIGYIDCYILASGATNTQDTNVVLFSTQDGISNTGVIVSYTNTGTAAVDSTSNQNFVLSSQAQNTGPLSGSLVIANSTIEKIA